MKNLIYNYLQFILITFFSLLFNLAIINGQTTVSRDSTVNFLTDYKGSLTVAKVPPAIDFGVIDIGDANPDLSYTHWGNVVLGPDKKFYYAIGDHNENGTVILKSYDPKIKTEEICIYSKDIPGLADGKWHGRPVIDTNTGDMYLTGFFRGQVVKYNIYSKNVTNYGNVGGQGWEEHIWDYERNQLYSVNSYGMILVYNTENNSVVFSGKPFPDLLTDFRARMIDMETGMFYATGGFGKFYNYNPVSKVFTKLNSTLPGSLRANTNSKEPDGSFWIFDDSGNMFKFFPEKDSLVPKGVNAGTGQYTAFIERSPNGNYLYYIAAGPYGHLIQYNTNTGEKKVIAQLSSYYSANYNYTISSFFGGALCRDGSSIFLVCYGRINSKQRAAFFNIHIPNSERNLETYVDTINIPDSSTNSTHYILTTSVIGKGKVSPISGAYREGTGTTLTATASEGWKFDKWTGDVSGTTGSIIATMNSNVSVIANFVKIPTDLSDQTNAALRFYPNPVKNNLAIEFQNELLQNGVIQLFDITGNLILNKKVQGFSHILEMGDLSPGIYLMKVSGNNMKPIITHITKQ